jgi:site-specific DNA recombinase
MVADLQAGVRDAVLVYNLDRLHRRPSELESFVELCEAVGVRDVATVAADIDLGNDDGLFMARIFAAFAAKESGRRSARVKRKLAANAEAGLPHDGALRPFGYERDRVTVIEDEAVLIRELVSRFTAGESLRSLASWLNQEEVATVAGGTWQTMVLRGLLRSPRIAGLREHRGEVIGLAAWPAIITTTDRDRVLARMATRAVTGKRTPRTYLLSGLLRCGKCGNRLYSQARHDRNGNIKRRYVCLSGPDHGGCGKLTVVAEPVEAVITEAVLARLDSTELADALAGKAETDSELVAVSDELTAATGRLEELACLYAEGLVTVRE